jgi:phosphatidate cytidylyltransferase
MQAVNGVTDIPEIRSGLPEMLKQRVLTAIVALAILSVVLFVVPAMVARMVIAVLMLAAAWEWSGFIFNEESKLKYVYVLFIAILIAVIYSELPNVSLLDITLKVSLGWWIAPGSAAHSSSFLRGSRWITFIC